jgi:dienelactone hydrolase
VRKLWTVLAAAALLAACGTAPATASKNAPRDPGVRTRTLALARGPDRPLPTTIWYPANLDGRHPIVLFSHGLGGLPEQFAPLTGPWAAAGYIVAAPAYPHTNGRVEVRRADVSNQPADAAYVLDRIRALDGAKNDIFAGHVDVGRVAVAGFSAGGTTTLGMLVPGHDPAIKAAICVAGRQPAAPMGGPPVSTLFVHGDSDPVVPIAAGRAAYAQVPWPSRRFVTIAHAGHGEYLHVENTAYGRTQAMLLEFLDGGIGRHAR